MVHVLLEFGAMQTSCLLHKRLMSKEKGKKNSKLNLNLTWWLVSLKLERRERKKLRIK